MYDCPGHEDEVDCDSYLCPGYYRCFDSQSCLHPSHVCDGISQCPRSDDELLCDLACPDQCTCHGLAFTCPQPFDAHRYPHLRYLNARGSGMTWKRLEENTMLVYLSLARCGLNHLANITFPNVNILDLSDNDLAVITFDSVCTLPNLKTLFLSNNPLLTLLNNSIGSLSTCQGIQMLDLSFNSLPAISEQFVNMFPNLRSLNLSQCSTQRVSGQGFQPMKQLGLLDLRGCPISEFQADTFKGLSQLQAVYGDSYKLCCTVAKARDVESNVCHAPVDEISSCQDLLRSNVYRVCLALLNVMALLGNSVSFVFRVASLKGKGSQGFSVFVLHLCVSDFLMGVYLSVIGVADRMYKNDYVAQDTSWRQSSVCKFAGFLSFLSSEVSAFIVCLITLDRLLVFRFPLSFWRFNGTHAQAAALLSWLVGLVVAAVPLAPFVTHWQFYSQTGICIPLPVTRTTFAGRDYSFGVMIVLNFLLFLVIAAGQVAIYSAIRSNAMKGTQTSQRSQDTDIARRLFTIAISDFLCWFPIGLLGMLASNDIPISGEISVVMAIIVMPLNSAINPFLYTLNVILEKTRRIKEQKLLNWLKAQQREK